MLYKVEKGIPIPAKRSGGGGDQNGEPKYPWPLMEIGDSFLIPALDLDEARIIARRVTGSLKGQRVHNGKVFTLRTSWKGVRVWRVE